MNGVRENDLKFIWVVHLIWWHLGCKDIISFYFGFYDGMRLFNTRFKVQTQLINIEAYYGYICSVKTQEIQHRYKIYNKIKVYFFTDYIIFN